MKFEFASRTTPFDFFVVDRALRSEDHEDVIAVQGRRRALFVHHPQVDLEAA